MNKKIKKLLVRYIKPIMIFFSNIIRDIGKSINTIYLDLNKILSFLYSPIVFIAGLGKYIFNNIKKYSNNSPLKSFGGFLKKIITNILSDIFEIIKLLYSPIIIIASIGKNLVETINKHFKDNHSNYIKNLDNFIKEKRYEWFPSRDRRRFERLKRKLFFAKNETFLNSNMYRIDFIATFGLQCISFFTTFRGSLTFFEGVHWSAPIIFTSVLQLLLLVLANTAFSKRRRFFGRKIMVCLLCCISIFLSYVGIANSVISPHDFYKNQYEIFVKSYTNVYDLIETKTTANNFDSQIETIFDNISAAKNNADKQIQILQKEINKNEGIQKTNYVRNELGLWDSVDNSANYTAAQAIIKENAENIEAINYIAKSKIMNSINTIKSNVKKIDTSSLESTSNYSESIKALQKNNQSAFADYTKLVDEYNSLISLDAMSNYGMKDKKISNDLLELIGSEAISLNIDSLKIKDFSELDTEAQKDTNQIDKDKPDKAKIIYDFLLQGTERPQHINYLYDKVRNEINQKYNSMQNAVNKLNSNKQIQIAFSDLEKTYNNDIDLREPYTFALSHLIDIKGGHYFKTLLMVFFAIIVDGLTVLIPILCEKRRESALFTKSNDDIIYEQEDVLENLLLSCAFPNPEDRKDLNELMYDENLYYDMLNTLSAYIKLYEPSPFTIKLGFPKRLKSNLLLPDFKNKEKSDEIENTGLYQELTSFLMEMGYVKFVSRQEYYLLKCDYYNVEPDIIEQGPEKDIAKRDWKSEKGYFLLKGNFILWMNDNRLAWLGKKHRKKKTNRQNNQADGKDGE